VPDFIIEIRIIRSARVLPDAVLPDGVLLDIA